MSNQIEIPPSFSQLFRSPAGRLTAPATTVLQRYELCEDLACALVEQAQSIYHRGHSDEEAVLLAQRHWQPCGGIVPRRGAMGDSALGRIAALAGPTAARRSLKTSP